MTPLPRLLLVPLPSPSPLLLGLAHPRLVVPPDLLDVLNDDELEMALRHELAHFARRDHLWRWLLLWLQDVSLPNPFTGYLCRRAVEEEEKLCDAMAVRSAREASLLARALKKVKDRDVPGQPRPSPMDAVVPALVGRGNGVRVLEARLESLIALTERESERAGQIRKKGLRLSVQILQNALRKAGQWLLGLLLFVVLYMKFYYVMDIWP